MSDYSPFLISNRPRISSPFWETREPPTFFLNQLNCLHVCDLRQQNHRRQVFAFLREGVGVVLPFQATCNTEHRRNHHLICSRINWKKRSYRFLFLCQFIGWIDIKASEYMYMPPEVCVYVCQTICLSNKFYNQYVYQTSFRILLNLFKWTVICASQK